MEGRGPGEFGYNGNEKQADNRQGPSEWRNMLLKAKAHSGL